MRFDLWREPIDRYTTEAAQLLATRVRPLLPRSSNELAGSVRVAQASSLGSEVKLLAPHAAAVHAGTRPHHPPRRAIEAWVQRRGGSRRDAYLVARAIARRGTKARPFMLLARKAAQSAIEGLLRRAGTEVGNRWGN